MKLSKLKNNLNNPRILKDDKFKKLVKSIKEFPKMMELRPMVIDKNNIVLGGNMRLKALKELGYKDIPNNWVKRADELTEAEKERFIIADNVGFGVWDWDELNENWDENNLIDWGLDIPEFDAEILEAKEDDYQEPETMQVDIILGDLVEFICEDGRVHRLLCGDSTCSDSVGKLMNGKKADMVFTSPPYNGNTCADRDNKTNLKGLYLNNQTDNKTSDKYIQFNIDVFKNIKLFSSKELVLLYNINYNRNSPSEYIEIINNGCSVFNLVETIIWKKSMAISLAGDNLTRIIEFIFVFYNGDDKPKLNKKHTNECIKNLWDISNIGANTSTHKACFPVALVEKAINIYAKKNALLYEPFTGSGTTMVAAHQLKRTCYGMELDEKYCQVIIDRMQKLDETLTVKINGKQYKKEAQNVPF